MPNPPRSGSRTGLTFIELVVVIVIIGLMVLFALPKLGPARDHAMVRNARSALTNLYSSARTAARTSNRVAVLRLLNDSVWVELNESFPGTGKTRLTGGGHSFLSAYGTTVTGPDSVRVDPRGMLLESGTHTWVFTRDGWSDSAMVNGYGRVVR